MTRKNIMSALCSLLLTLGIFGLVYSPSFGIQNVGPFIVPGASVNAHNTNGFGSQYARVPIPRIPTAQELPVRGVAECGILGRNARTQGIHVAAACSFVLPGNRGSRSFIGRPLAARAGQGAAIHG